MQLPICLGTIKQIAGLEIIRTSSAMEQKTRWLLRKTLIYTWAHRSHPRLINQGDVGTPNVENMLILELPTFQSIH